MNVTNYTVTVISSIIKGSIIKNDENDIVIRDILFDSRMLVYPESTIFFALKSRRNDGHKYISDLHEKGVRAFVVEDTEHVTDSIGGDSKAVVIKVDDTLKALQELGSWHRKQFDIPIVGITGSNGKTIVKEWLYQILGSKMSVIRSPRSYNSQIGVPLSVWQINESHQVAIIEAGISRPGEMQKIKDIVSPTIGIFTNIGQAHGKNFADISHKTAEKLQLFSDVDVMIYCSDHEEIRKSVRQTDINTFSWSRKDRKADIFVCSIEKGKDHTEIKAIDNTTTGGRNIGISIPFTDDASIENAIHCWLAAMKFDIPDDIIQERMHSLNPIAMRMELKSGINNCDIINDSYNSDINSLSIALDFMKQQIHNKKSVVILSDILQSELKEEELYDKIAQLIKNKNVSKIIGIGEAITRQSDKFNIDRTFYSDTTDFLTRHPIEDFHNQLILLKGAREFGFEKISRALQEKAHETILEIDLNNLVKNMNYYRSKLKKDTKLMVMVKAFAYGSGNYEVSNVLEFHHADYLTVAYADEGIELRRKGIRLPIMVMTPESNTYESIIKNDLEPDIYSFRSLSLLEDAIRQSGAVPEKGIGIHIKLDTGMHRLGFLKEDIDELIARIESNKNITVKSVFSHLAGSDSEEFNEFTMRQLEVFEKLSDKIIAAFPYKIMRHILNSAGISRFTEYQYDMVRLGIGIYGIAPCKEDEGKLHNVVSLRSTVVQIKEYDRGETVGYSRKGVIERKSRIGVIPIGYADGLKRQLGNGNASFYINGKPAPTIGNICMDMCMVDLTGIECSENDTAILFDKDHAVEDIAKACGTIPYEILTSISQRVKRIYYQE